MFKGKVWKKQTMAEDCVTVDCPAADPIKDFIMEPTGHYVLVRVNRKKSLIELAVCDAGHRIIAVFRGKKPVDIYTALFRFEKEKGRRWFEEKTHAAYIGKELRKAQEALSLKGQDYWQE